MLYFVSRWIAVHVLVFIVHKLLGITPGDKYFGIHVKISNIFGKFPNNLVMKI